LNNLFGDDKQKMEYFKPVSYKIIEKGYSVLLIDKDPKWVLPSACFSVGFYADPKEVLKYGPNGLHFAEHILWNMIAKNILQRTNASTFSGGEMAVYGTCMEANLREAMTQFFEGLIDMAECKLSRQMREVFKIEQQRVSCETSFMQEGTSTTDHPQEHMFVFNTDMIHAAFSPDYVWKILLDECELGRIIIVAHCKMLDEDTALFEKMAAKFEAAWNNRKKSLPEKIPLPVYYAPPYSMFTNGRKEESKTLVRYENDMNPIERVIMRAELGLSNSPYIFGENVPLGWNPTDSTLASKDLQYLIEWYDQYFSIPLLVSFSGPFEEEWIADLHSKKPGQLVKKYRGSAISKFLKTVEERKKKI
jgi:hypothetical protein